MHNYPFTDEEVSEMLVALRNYAGKYYADLANLNYFMPSTSEEQQEYNELCRNRKELVRRIAVIEHLEKKIKFEEK